jgi:cobalt-zinc-cadmium efflux system membrane fusion protein
VGAVLLAAGVLAQWTGRFAPQAGLRAEERKKAGPQLVPGEPDAVRLPAETVVKFGISTGVAKPRGAARPGELVLPGSTALDPARLSRVRSRIGPATVVEIAKVPVDGEIAEIRAGTVVKKGQLLAVLQSPEVAAKKSELVDALVQLHLDRQVLARAEEGGSLPEIFILNARRHVQTSTAAANRAETALRAWQIPEATIQALKAYAESVIPPKGKRDPEKEKAWPRVEVLAPRDGVVVERNIAADELIVDSMVTLFTIADTSRLLVLVSVPEDDLPALRELPPEKRRWSIRVAGQAPVDGQIDEIDYLVDPNQHAALVRGAISNAEGRLRAGQFVTAVLPLRGTARELVVPASALVEAGSETFVFVQPDPAKPIYVQRPVTVLRRGNDTAHVRYSSKPDERIVTAGALDLKAALDDLRAARK